MVKTMRILWALALLIAGSDAYPSGSSENSEITSPNQEEFSAPANQESEVVLGGSNQGVAADTQANHLAIYQVDPLSGADDYARDIGTVTVLKRRDLEEAKKDSSDDDLTPPTREGAVGNDGESSDLGRCGGGSRGFGGALATQLLLSTLLNNAAPTNVDVARSARPNGLRANPLAQLMALLRRG